MVLRGGARPAGGGLAHKQLPQPFQGLAVKALKVPVHLVVAKPQGKDIHLLP